MTKIDLRNSINKLINEIMPAIEFLKDDYIEKIEKEYPDDKKKYKFGYINLWGRKFFKNWRLDKWIDFLEKDAEFTFCVYNTIFIMVYSLFDAYRNEHKIKDKDFGNFKLTKYRIYRNAILHSKNKITPRMKNEYIKKYKQITKNKNIDENTLRRDLSQWQSRNIFITRDDIEALRKEIFESLEL